MKDCFFLQLICRDQEALWGSREVGSPHTISLLASSPVLAAEASSAMQKLCSTTARGEGKHHVFCSSLGLPKEQAVNQQTSSNAPLVRTPVLLVLIYQSMTNPSLGLGTGTRPSARCCMPCSCDYQGSNVHGLPVSKRCRRYCYLFCCSHYSLVAIIGSTRMRRGRIRTPNLRKYR